MPIGDMEILNAKVATLEDTLQAAFEELQIVKTQQRALQARQTITAILDERRPTPVAIHAIPVELLIQIFISAVHATDRVLSSAQDAQDAFRYALTVSHVCRLWREAALQTSSLWAHVLFSKNLRGVRTTLNRAKLQPLTIVRAPPRKRYPTLPEKNIAMKSHLEATSSRWTHIHWISSDITMRHVLSELNRLPTFPFLATLDLVVDERRLLGPRYMPFIPDFSTTVQSRFPKLEYLKLTQVPPSDLPPVTTPSLRFLYLHFPHKQQPEQREWSHLLRMSGLCAVLYRAPNLEELIIDDSIILMDIRLRPNDGAEHGPPVDPGVRQTHHVISPISMNNLTRFQWDFAPARDLWRLFYFVRMPSLRQLDIILDRSDERWQQVRGGLVSNIGNIQPISELLTHPVVRFEMLEDLRVECLDTDGLSTAFRKLEFPNLKSLSMTFVEVNVPSHHKYHRTTTGPEIASQLPRAESIFRDPRMPNLTSFELANFHLDVAHTKGMLQYMPALEKLSLDSCTNAGPVVRTLNSVPDEGETSQEEEWLCPGLLHLSLRSCHDVGHRSVGMVARHRKIAATTAGPSSPRAKRALIPLRTRKRGIGAARQGGLLAPPGKLEATDQSFPAQTSTTASAALSSAGGWKSHERKKPRMLKSVFVEDCDGFDETGSVEELRQYVEELVWIPVLWQVSSEESDSDSSS
ncbi:hypothetical protein EUX98_g587 [Antrodiella citrinella]|uniref:F-box domain-containing protein n=1 Tax=Antrodiella citrinella TaxID=2447956 RepID=A0A4V3XJM7_9APHY|nr:hypothetical protein EUX98_g587 [Antrodiella citrinella]